MDSTGKMLVIVQTAILVGFRSSLGSGVCTVQGFRGAQGLRGVYGLGVVVVWVGSGFESSAFGKP